MMRDLLKCFSDWTTVYAAGWI